MQFISSYFSPGESPLGSATPARNTMRLGPPSPASGAQCRVLVLVMISRVSCRVLMPCINAVY